MYLPTFLFADDFFPSLDVGTILALIRELAVYEKAPDSVLADEPLLLKNLGLSESGPSETTARAILLFEGDIPAGLAVYFYNFSTWTGMSPFSLSLYFLPSYNCIALSWSWEASVQGWTWSFNR